MAPVKGGLFITNGPTSGYRSQRRPPQEVPATSRPIPTQEPGDEPAAAGATESTTVTSQNAKTKPKPSKKRGAEPTTSEPATDDSNVQQKQKVQSAAKKAKIHEHKDTQAVVKKAGIQTGTSKDAPAGKKAKRTASIPLPNTYEKAVAADKYLFDNREAGKSFEEMTPHWLQLAGRSPDEQLSRSMLSNRYMRMKINFSMIKEQDHVLLFEAKKHIESTMEDEKWSRIATEIISKGGDAYRAEDLQRCYGKLMKKGGDLSKIASPRDRDIPANDDEDD